MDNTNKLTTLDKILLKLVFQVDQGSQRQKGVKEQIQIHSANIIKKREHIDNLLAKSRQLDDEINRMQKISTHAIENFKVWKPTCLLLTQHEENFEKQLVEQHACTVRDNHKASSDRRLQGLQRGIMEDREYILKRQLYQDYIKQYRDILQQHQSQYSEFPQAKEFLKKKVELEEIRCRVLDCTEQMKQKTELLAELLEPPSFGSLHEWALEIARLKIDTNNMLGQIDTFRKEKPSEDPYEQPENTAQIDDSESEEINELQSDMSHINLPNIDTSKEQVQRIYLQHEYSITLDTVVSPDNAQSQKHAMVNQKSTLPLKPFKLARTQSPAESESGTHKNLQASNVLVSQLNSLQKGCEDSGDNIQAPIMEFCTSLPNHEKPLVNVSAAVPQDTQNSMKTPEISGSHQQKKFQMTLATKNQGQAQYCPFVPQDQEAHVSWLENNLPISDDGTMRKMDANQSKAFVRAESTYNSKAGDTEEATDVTPQIFSRPPEQDETEQKEFEMNSYLPLEETPLKSSGFSFLNTSTPKSTGFNLFGRMPFDLTDTPEQETDTHNNVNQFEFSSLFFKKTPEKAYSTNVTSNLQSPPKDIGMMSPSSEQPFAFSFQSDLSSNNYGNSKDDFSFGFSFGQDQRSTQPGLFKFF
ncbi:protein SIX6OS1-like [Leucoraja erinacea]|uniref:protein SIX6OS1-like n=1 Tax=Leucoraja erinaceus TaxID=7782 RepID=UPI00245608A1|nr:protein SIX6OS1-like [Leucoraja erinacea]